MRPQINQDGTTYTDNGSFSQAHQAYQGAQRQQRQQQFTDQYTQQATAQPAANPYLDQYTQLIKNVQDRMSAPMQDVYSTPQFAAAQATQNRNAGYANRQAQESMGESGFGRSTNLADRVQHNQNSANEYLMTQMVPQIQQQLAGQRQAEITNQMAILNPVMSLMNRQDTLAQNHLANLKGVTDLLGSQNQNDITNQRNAAADARADAGMTGYYMPQGARESINAILDLKRQAEQQGVTPDQMSQFKTAADAERAKLYQMGVDPNVVGFDANYDQAAKNVANFKGIQTMQGRNNELNEVQLMAQLTGKMPDGTPTTAQQQVQLSNLWKVADATGAIPAELAKFYGLPENTPTLQAKQIAASITNMSNDNTRADDASALARERFDWDKDPNNPNNIYKESQADKASAAPTAETYSKYIDSVAVYDKEKKLTNPDAVESAILSSGLPEYEMFKLYKAKGLKWDGPIPEKK